MKLARRTTQIAASPTLALSAKAKELKSQGIDVIDFGVGEPDFDTPEHIKQAGIKAIQSGFTKYTAAAGIPELKKVIVEKLKKNNNLEYTQAQVLIGCGGKHVLYDIMWALIDAGDEVILPAPYWVTYPEQVKMSDGINVIIQTKEENDFKMTPEEFRAAITSKTKALILNSPSNPTGSLYTPEELKAIADICVEKGIYVISDECYEDLVYDGKQVSIASFGPEIKELTVVCYTFSKSYSMTGWRLGYCAGPTDIIKAMSEFQSHTTSNPTSFVQKAGIEALVSPQSAPAMKAMYDEFDKRRIRTVELLNQVPGVTCRTPSGAFYAFPNITGLLGKTYKGRKVENDSDLSAFLLEEAHIAVVPGSSFGFDGFLRFSYATSMENIEKGISRMIEVLK